MSSDFLTFVESRRTKIRKQIQRLEMALVELDKSEKLFRMSEKVQAKARASGQPGLEFDQSAKAPSKIGQGLNVTVGGGTIKEAVLALLADFPNGLTADEVLAKLNAGPMPTLARSSLSPQLSRLRHIDGAVAFRDSRWFLGGESSASEGGQAPPSISE